MSYKCKVCGKTYESKSWLTRHMKKEHSTSTEEIEELLRQEVHTLFDKVPRSGLKKAAVEALAKKINALS